MRRVWLAIPILLLAACGDEVADCPGSVVEGQACSGGPATCFAGASTCSCAGGVWKCQAADMGVPDLSTGRDLATSD